MKWNHISDKQPDHDDLIIQVDLPYGGHCCMGMRKYHQTCSYEEVLSDYKKLDIPPPNFYWIFAKDFPFPFSMFDK